MCPVTRVGPERVARLARAGEQVADDFHRMAHHVVEHAAALQLALPEPGHVRPAVLLGGAGQIRAPGERGAAGPDQMPPVLHLRREQLVLQISGVEPHALHERVHLLRFGHVAGQRLLAGEPPQRSARPRSIVLDDLLDVLDAGVVGAAQPEGVDFGIGHHRARSSGTASPRRCRAIARTRPPLPARLASGLHTPRTSASRTAVKACMWKRALNPLPTNPMRRAG